MGSFGHNFLWFVLIVGLGFVGYWGWTSLDDATSITYDRRDVVVAVVEDDLPVDTTDELPEFLESPTSGQQLTPGADTVPEEYAALAEGIQELIDSVVYMQVGSRGTRVGFVQQFLNIYNDTNLTVDNDYGPGTKQAVLNFQADQGITADGAAGPQTYQKMLDWLSRQSG